MNLQSVLLIIGVVIVASIYLAAKWQQRRRHRPRRPLRGAPNLGAMSARAPAGGVGFAHDDREIPPMDAVAENADATADATATATDMPPPPPPSARPPTRSSARPPTLSSARPLGFHRLSQIDYWVKITGARDVGRESVLGIYRDAVSSFTKAHSIHGQKVPGNEWCNLEYEAEDSRFADLVVTLQLADRDGAISESEMTRFSMLVSRLSEGTGREFLFMAPIDSALAQADAIAEFAAHFAVVFTLTIRPPPGETLTGAAIESSALQMGLERDGAYYSRFKTVGRRKVALYSLADISDSGAFDFAEPAAFRTDGVVFLTRPALNQSPGAVFAEMADAARVFAARIKGTVSAPARDDLSQADVDEMRRDIERLEAQMSERGIDAGGEEATRIF